MSTIDIGIAEPIQSLDATSVAQPVLQTNRKPAPIATSLPESNDFYVGSVKLDSPVLPSTNNSNASAGTGLLNK